MPCSLSVAHHLPSLLAASINNRKISNKTLIKTLIFVNLNLMEEVNKSLEAQKEEIMDIANEKFGKAYFEKLEELSKNLMIEEEAEDPEYTISVNYQGAFYAS